MLIEDYGERNKKGRKSRNSKCLELPAEKVDYSPNNHSLVDVVDSSNLADAPTTAKFANLQDAIKLEMDIEPLQKTQSYSPDPHTLVPQTMAKEVIGIESQIQQPNSALNWEADLIRMERQGKVSVGVMKAGRPNKWKPIKLLRPDKRPVCQLCAISFKNKYVLNHHLQCHHSTMRRFRCKCGKTYKYLHM